ncbi:MAG TPA: sigma-54 dependent transcriptional regulator [Candidatus Saccharimonadales bacterium]|nr:sigma-54 dependent transcriptional regulator [Candidatus Saccharimonadales bacterium]
MIEDCVHILAVDDDRTFLDDLGRLMAPGFRLVKAYTVQGALEAVRGAAFDAVLLDLDLGRGTDGFEVLDYLREHEPDLPVIMVTRDASSASAVAALKRGAVDYLDKRPNLEDLERRISRAVDEQRLRRRQQVMAREIESVWGPMVGESPVMLELRDRIRQAAGGTSPVLIAGETGTGKELVARGVHRLSCPSGPFRAVNCAAVPETLFENELFGSERGAYTGAEERFIGAFEQASHGVLYLDEITEMSLGLQAKLLRVVEEREFRRLRGEQRVLFRGRLLASTKRDPEQAVRDGLLRDDLYYRLNTFQLRTPPLRERAGDIPLLVDHFLERKSAETGRPRRPVPGELMARLCAHPWPGNVRELQGAVERFLAGGALLPPGPPRGEGGNGHAAATPGREGAGALPGWSDALLELPYKKAKEAVVRSFQKRYLDALLAAHRGDVARTAEAIGVSAFGLQKMLRQLEGQEGA